ncbi:MAG TPA: hypothetical protein VFR81_05090 [Longimicrobium sp.]|nr:hypothetical protein [Longimicrobium sp.]
MHETFGFRLRRFALAVDIIDDDIFRQTWGLILDYVSPHLRPSYWALLTESEVNFRPGLTPRDCSVANHSSFNLYNPDDTLTGLAAYSYVREKPLWVVAPDHGPIGPETPIQDVWSKSADLPPFDRPESEGIRTVVHVPLRWKGRRLGLLDLQSRDYHELTHRVAAEMENLADTLAVLLPLCSANEERRQHTIEAIDLHRKALKDDPWPPLTKPQIFVASSGRADPAVIGVIRDVLQGFEDHVRVCYWRDSPNGGNIKSAMLKEIQASQFGLCYFSEPDPDGGFRFRDNANVVFEAGMLEALTHSAAPGEMGWIPVREGDSPPAPFDFAQERMVIVPRLGASGALNQESLRSELATRLEQMLA